MSANPHAARMRRALVAAAEALADFLEAEGARPVAATEPPAEATVPNNEIAERFALDVLKGTGWPTPTRAKRRGTG